MTRKPRVLLVEDESFIALDLALDLQTKGYEVLGPCRSADEAREAIERLYPDVAVLDVNLGRESDSFGVAQMLEQADIPFLFVSGYSEATVPLPDGLKGTPRLRKPVEPAELARRIEALLG